METTDHSKHPTLIHPNAVQMNKDLLSKFHKALDEDPTTDLLSIIPRSYHLQHRKSRFRALTSTAQLNLRTVNRLYDKIEENPEVNLLKSAFPSDYTRKFIPASEPQIAKHVSEPPASPEFRTKLDGVSMATTSFPLSSGASTLLKRYSKLPDCDSITLATSLKRLIWDSERIWELAGRGVVVKCSDELVIKLSNWHNHYTEYKTLQYLAEHAPKLPVPRPHGMIVLGRFCATFMSYIPGITLEEAWPSLSHDGKLSIQTQLDLFFRQLRVLKQRDKVALGGVENEGVRDYRIDETRTFKGITTARGFDEFQFSANHRASPSYAELLRSFLREENATLHGSVFTHGDLKKMNIMVKQDWLNKDLYTITGITDWENSGFYPEYYECTTLSNGQNILEDDDWYLYVPESISPLRFPVRWLVDRLWGNLLCNWRADIVR